ncbi:MAG: hypothetical protein JWR08_1088, partial [Enterovirga sp.]|nr:hypothetical protein [Enterovirga sp.]
RLAWELGEERVLLSAAGGPAATPVALPGAARLGLKPLADAALPKPPERAGRMPGGLAGQLTLSVPEAGLYRVTLSAEAWIDVVQGDAYRPAEASSGVRNCPGIRKSVKFRLEPGAATVQVSGAGSEAVTVAVTRDR